MSHVRRAASACTCLLVLVLPAAAAAAGVDSPTDQWLPRSDGAEWTYQWSNSDYAPTPHKERFRVVSRSGTSFRLRWEEIETGPYETPSQGTMDFRHDNSGLVNLNYQSTQPPPQFPVLCASAAECGNSVASPLYMVIWGTRSPTLAEPLVRGTRWNSVGGANNDVASANRYLGTEQIRVPAFPGPVTAAVVESEITQAGALGDPFGSGVRTVHWVRGVGPVRITFRHGGGELSSAELLATTTTPLPTPSDENFLPLNRGDRAVFRWRNSRHMKTWSKQQFDVAEVVNNSARVDVKHLAGPIRLAASYAFATRLSGITNVQAATKAATRARFPKLGPKSASADRRRRLFTPYDFMTYGFNPVLPAYPQAGDSWRSSRDSADFKTFGVIGTTKILGLRKVKTPAGTFQALAVKSSLSQAGFPYGSGTRTSYFAAGKGLVKLVFRHRDRSVSTVERLR